MKRIGNFIYENRITNVILRHGPMILKPATVAALMTIVWHYMYINKIYLDKSDMPLTTDIPLIGICYGIFAALAINFTWSKYSEMSSAVVTRNKEKFLALRDEKMPIMLHIFLGSMALSIQLFVLLIDYENPVTGLLLVLAITYFLTLTAVIAIELDDPKRSIWFQKSIPSDWLSADVKDYFDKKAQAIETMAD